MPAQQQASAMDGHDGAGASTSLPGNPERGDGSDRGASNLDADAAASGANETKVMPLPRGSRRGSGGGIAAAARRRRSSGGSRGTRRGSSSRAAFPSRKALDSGRQQMAMLAREAQVSVRDGVVEDNLHAFKPSFGAAFNFSHYLDSEGGASGGAGKPLSPIAAGAPSLVAHPMSDGESSAGGNSPAKDGATPQHGDGGQEDGGDQGQSESTATDGVGKSVTWANNTNRPRVDTAPGNPKSASRGIPCTHSMTVKWGARLSRLTHSCVVCSVVGQGREREDQAHAEFCCQGTTLGAGQERHQSGEAPVRRRRPGQGQ